MILGQKVIPFVGNVFEYDIVFGALEFSSATGYPQLQGPLSIAIDVVNNTKSVFLIGVTIERDIGSITVADRGHIGGVQPNGTATLSSASIPQLASIDGIVTKITLRVSTFESVLSGPPPASTITLRLDGPKNVFSPPAFFGKDYRIIEPAFHVGFSTFNPINVPAGSVDFVARQSGTMIAPFRHKYSFAQIVLYPTPSYPGDLHCKIRFIRLDGLTYYLGRVFSKTDDFAYWEASAPIILNVGESMQFLLTNTSANDYSVEVNVWGEAIY